MERLFLVVLSLSVSGSLVGLLIWLCRPAFGRIFSKRWIYYLWLLVAARLLLPIHADVNLMAYLSGSLSSVAENWRNGTQGTGASEDEINGPAGTEVRESGEPASGAGQSEAPEFGEPKDVSKDTDIMKAGKSAEILHDGKDSAQEASDMNLIERDAVHSGIASDATAYGMADSPETSRLAYILRFAAIVWVCGAVFAFMRKLWIYRRFVKEVGMDSAAAAEHRQMTDGWTFCAACAPVRDERVLMQYAEIQRKLRIGKRVPLYESEGVDGPMLIGLFRPRICLPKALLTEMDGRENDICLILHHELVHYKRHDIWLKWLFQAAVCVHWFNPLVYLFSRRFSIDCELACDETVLKLLSEEGRRAYGNVLLDVARMDWCESAFSGKGLGKRGDVPAMTLLEEKSTLKERLGGIARYHKTGLAVGFCSALVLAMFLSVALVCGAAGVRAGSEEAFTLRNQSHFVGRFVEPLWEKSLWSDMWEDAFDLDQPIQINSEGTAYQIYDDDTLIAGKSENDAWSAWTYTGGDKSVDAKKLVLNGSDTLWIFYANKETTLEIFSAFDLYDGRFKIVWVGPDQTVQTINETGGGNVLKLTLPQGRNAIKMVGQKAKLKNLDVSYGGIKKGDFDGIYDNEATEYAHLVLEGKQALDPVRLRDAYPYLEEKEVSELGRKAWEEGVVLSKEDWSALFIYSNEKLSAQYLKEALQAGKAGEFDSKILVGIAPYMSAEDVSDCFHYLLEWDTVSTFDYGDIFVYSDANQSAEYLAEALRSGKVSGFDDKALQSICYQVSTKPLTDLVLAMGKEELSFDGLKYALAFVQKQDEAVMCVCHYIDLGNVLTDEQLEDVRPYVSEVGFYRVVEYNGKKK